MRLFGYVVLENHLHFIASAENLSDEIGNFKSFTARKVIDRLKEKNDVTILRHLAFEKDPRKTDRDFQLWQEGSQPKQIMSDEMMRQKLDYMHYNPVKRGYVDDPIHWRYSSARNYAQLPNLLDVVTDWNN